MHYFALRFCSSKDCCFALFQELIRWLNVMTAVASSTTLIKFQRWGLAAQTWNGKSFLGDQERREEGCKPSTAKWHYGILLAELISLRLFAKALRSWLFTLRSRGVWPLLPYQGVGTTRFCLREEAGPLIMPFCPHSILPLHRGMDLAIFSNCQFEKTAWFARNLGGFT